MEKIFEFVDFSEFCFCNIFVLPATKPSNRTHKFQFSDLNLNVSVQLDRDYIYWKHFVWLKEAFNICCSIGISFYRIENKSSHKSGSEGLHRFIQHCINIFSKITFNPLQLSSHSSSHTHSMTMGTSSGFSSKITELIQFFDWRYVTLRQMIDFNWKVNMLKIETWRQQAIWDMHRRWNLKLETIKLKFKIFFTSP